MDNTKPNLTDNSKEMYEGHINMQECIDELKTMTNNKTPGTDGFPPEFYKYFLQDVGQYLLRSFQ